MTTIKDFFNDRVGIPKGDYIHLLLDSPFTINGKGQTVKFSELSKVQKTYLKFMTLNVTIVQSISRRELSEYFDALNDGVRLNDQEKRNSWWS